MIVKIQSGSSEGSKSLVDYLEKENEGKEIDEKNYFFSHMDDFVSSYNVENDIDNNKRGLSSKDIKFYSVILSPSKEELKHIGNDENKLQNYTRNVMDKYAENFGKGLKGSDLVYFAKIEHERHVKGFDHVKGEFLDQKQGEKKKGLNTHIHIIVSRNSSSNATTKSGKQFKLSPTIRQKSRTWKANGVSRTAGFNRLNFTNDVEKGFDKQFEYKRKLEERFEYKYAQKHGDIKELEQLEIAEKMDKQPKKIVSEKGVNKETTNKIESKKENNQSIENDVNNSKKQKKDKGRGGGVKIG